MHLDAAVDLFLVRRGHVERRDEPERAVAEARGGEVVDRLDLLRVRVRVRVRGG